MDMKDLAKDTSEISPMVCENCEGTDFKVYIATQRDGRTQLLMVCSNKECVKERRKQIEAPEDSLIVWNEFDITGQGYDHLDLLAPEEIN